MRIEVVVDVKTTLGEGPLWDAEQERLYWIDVFDGRVFRATEAGAEIRCWDVPQKIGSLALRKDGGGAVVEDSLVVAGQERQIVRQARVRDAEVIRRDRAVRREAVDERRVCGVADDLVGRVVLHHDVEDVIERLAVIGALELQR